MQIRRDQDIFYQSYPQTSIVIQIRTELRYFLSLLYIQITNLNMSVALIIYSGKNRQGHFGRVTVSKLLSLQITADLDISGLLPSDICCLLSCVERCFLACPSVLSIQITTDKIFW